MIRTEETKMDLSPEELQRYARHISMPEVGLEGQKKLKAAKVLCIGAGGLGSPIAMYLAAAGVGTLGIVDPDVVDESNLQRQLLHGTNDVGRKKLESAADTIAQVNPHVRVNQYDCPFTADNAMEIAADYDIIIDGTDNFPTRYLSNDVAVFLKKPNIYGSIFRFEGQCSVFAPHLGGPCYRCLFPQPPEPGLVPSCAEGGVLGLLPGQVGVMQGTEAVKLILGQGEPLIGRLLHIDALASRYREIKLRKDPNCPVCGENPTITGPIDYEAFCGVPKAPEQTATNGSVPGEISVTELAAAISAQTSNEAEREFHVIDVREPFENGICSIPSAQLFPLDTLRENISSLPASGDLYIHCKSGMRSARAISMLAEAGIPKTRMRNITGGIDAWAAEIDPDMRTY